MIEPEKNYEKYKILEKKEKFDEKFSEQLSMHGIFGGLAPILESLQLAHFVALLSAQLLAKFDVWSLLL